VQRLPAVTTLFDAQHNPVWATPFNMVIFVPRAWQSRRACRSDRRCAPVVSS
jgi:hypothetical protein